MKSGFFNKDKAGFFNKEQINQPIADSAHSVTSEKAAWEKQGVGKDSFAVDLGRQRGSSPQPNSSAQPQPAAVIPPAPETAPVAAPVGAASTGPISASQRRQNSDTDDLDSRLNQRPELAEGVDETMSDVLKAARELSKKVNGRRVDPDGEVPSPEYYQRAVDAVQGAIEDKDAAEKKKRSVKPVLSHSF